MPGFEVKIHTLGRPRSEYLANFHDIANDVVHSEFMNLPNYYAITTRRITYDPHGDMPLYAITSDAAAIKDSLEGLNDYERSIKQQREHGMTKVGLAEQQQIGSLLKGMLVEARDMLLVDQAESEHGPRASQATMCGLWHEAQGLVIAKGQRYIPAYVKEFLVQRNYICYRPEKYDGKVPSAQLTIAYDELIKRAPQVVERLNIGGSVAIRREYELLVTGSDDLNSLMLLPRLIIDFTRMGGEEALYTFTERQGLQVARAGALVPSSIREPMDTSQGRHLLQSEAEALKMLCQELQPAPPLLSQLGKWAAQQFSRHVQGNKYTL